MLMRGRRRRRPRRSLAELHVPSGRSILCIPKGFHRLLAASVAAPVFGPRSHGDEARDFVVVVGAAFAAAVVVVGGGAVGEFGHEFGGEVAEEVGCGYQAGADYRGGDFCEAVRVVSRGCPLLSSSLSVKEGKSGMGRGKLTSIVRRGTGSMFCHHFWRWQRRSQGALYLLRIRCMGSVSDVSSEILNGRRGIQYSCGKDRADSYPPIAWHLQPPYRDDRYQENHKIGDHVDRAARDKNGLVVDAVTRLGWIPKLAPRYTGPYFDWEVGDIE